MELSTVLKLVSLSKSIAEYLGIIESLGDKIDMLCGAELNAGIRTLKQANSSENEKESLLRAARNYFNKAISLEKNDRLIVALTGLALCHSYLGDKNNAKNTQLEIEATEFDMNELDKSLQIMKDTVQNLNNLEKAVNTNPYSYVKKIALGLTLTNPIFIPTAALLSVRVIKKEFEVKKFQNLKKTSLNFLENIQNETSN